MLRRVHFSRLHDFQDPLESHKMLPLPHFIAFQICRSVAPVHQMLCRVHFSPLQLILTLSKFDKILTKSYPWYTFTHMHICRLSSEVDKMLVRGSLGECKNSTPGILFILFRSSHFRGETSAKSFNIPDSDKNLTKVYPWYTFLIMHTCQHHVLTIIDYTKL